MKVLKVPFDVPTKWNIVFLVINYSNEDDKECFLACRATYRVATSYSNSLPVLP
jgi:hypothetical protein